ncbi:MAG: rhomboid family intramembrane serine protease, partial [Planctomycetes bacterium]|nr:rhomboid family intramembrane serine protease [Planctomycetota bacterium]
MAFPLNVDVPMNRLPVANWVLLAIILIVSTWWLAHRPHPPPPPPLLPEEAPEVPEEVHYRDWFKQFLARVKKEPPAPPLALNPDHFSPWQLLTFDLVHNDVWHLVGSMLFLFCFGNAINAKLGHLPFLVLFFGMGTLAGLLWLALGADKPLVGSAGAVMGVLGVFLVFYPKNNVRLATFGLTGLATRERPAILFVALGMASDLVGSILSPFGAMDYLCHLLVEVSGILVAIGLLLAGWAHSPHYEQNLLQVFG